MTNIKKKGIEIITYESGRIECFPYFLRNDDVVLWISHGTKPNYYDLKEEKPYTHFSSIEDATNVLEIKYQTIMDGIRDRNVIKIENINVP